MRAQDTGRSLFRSADSPSRYQDADAIPPSAPNLAGALRGVNSSIADEYADAAANAGPGLESDAAATPPAGSGILLTQGTSRPRPAAPVSSFRLTGDANEPTPAVSEAASQDDSAASGGLQSVLKRRPSAQSNSLIRPRVAALPPAPAPLRDPDEMVGEPIKPVEPTPAAEPQIADESDAPIGGGLSSTTSSRRTYGGPSPAELAPAPKPIAAPPTNDAEEQAASSRRTQRMAVSPVAPPATPAFTAPAGGIGMLSASQGALIRVESVGPRAIVLGKAAQFTITALNQSDLPARDLNVRIGLPSWVQLSGAEPSTGSTRKQADASGIDQLVWTIDNLEARGRQQLTLKLMPIENRPFELAVDWALMPVSMQAQIQVQKPELEIALSGPKDLLFGQTETYTITVTNPGTGDAENVSVQLAAGKSAGKSHALGVIGAGQQRQIQVELTAQQAGQLELTALAAAEGGLETSANRTVQVRQARLEIEVAGPPLKFAGTVATYQVRVSNIGDAPADRIVAAVKLPSGSKHVPINDGPQPSAELTWNLGVLRPGADAVFNIGAQLLSPGENRLEVQVRGAADIAADRIVATRVEAIADLKLVVNDPKGPKPVGEEVVYEIEVTNRGTKAAEQINVVAQFSEGIEPVRAEGSQAELVPGQVLFHPIGRLEPGQKLTLKVTAKASTEGNHRFRAEVTCDQPETRLAAEDSTRYYKLDVPQFGSRAGGTIR
ncbi:MAG: CARDB domain-containing protein [Pirellulaceae bacterium]